MPESVIIGNRRLLLHCPVRNKEGSKRERIRKAESIIHTMKNIPKTEYLKTIRLFHEMTDEEILEALGSLRAYTKTFERNEFILNAGDCTKELGILLEGRATIETNDMWGNHTILGMVGKDELFAESYAILCDEPLLVDVRCGERCTILFLSASDLVRNYSNQLWQNKMIRNLLMISARKNLHLSARAFQTSSKSARVRIMAYLNAVSLRTGETLFEIPFDRQQMADYLNLERTALSKELGRMKKDGIIDFHKNTFRLLKPQ